MYYVYTYTTYVYLSYLRGGGARARAVYAEQVFDGTAYRNDIVCPRETRVTVRRSCGAF